MHSVVLWMALSLLATYGSTTPQFEVAGPGFEDEETMPFFDLGTRERRNSDPCASVRCHPNARCHNGNCHCEFGYEGDAKHNCDRVDLCKRLGCHAFARCHDGRCKCDPGYSGDGYRECIRASSAKGNDVPMESQRKGQQRPTPSPRPSEKAAPTTPSVKGPPPPAESTKGQPVSVTKGPPVSAALTGEPMALHESPDPDQHIGLPYSIDLLSFLPSAPKGREFASEPAFDGGPEWQNYKSPRRPLPAPLPIRTVFPTSYLPRELIHPISFMVEFSPFERSRPGRSFLVSRVDRHGRLRFAVAVNQWGNHGEYMELWIHHDNFFTARYDPVMGLQYSGGLMPTTGIATVPLPRAEPGTQKPIRISLELSDRDLQVFSGCPSDENRIFSLYYSPRQNMNAGKGMPTPPPVSAKGKGQTAPDNDVNDSTHDKIYLLSGGPVHNSRYRGLVRDMKLFFSRDGASRYCTFRQGSSPPPTKAGPMAVRPAPSPDAYADQSTSMPVTPEWTRNSEPLHIPGVAPPGVISTLEPSYDTTPVSEPPSQYRRSSSSDEFLGLGWDQSRQKGVTRQEICVRVTPSHGKGETVRLEKIRCP